MVCPGPYFRFVFEENLAAPDLELTDADRERLDSVEILGDVNR